MPTTIPDLVEPCLSKVDLPRLVQDAPKYYNSGTFHEDATVWWKSFVSDFESTYGATPSDKPNWPLDVLKSRSVVVMPAGETSVPDKISALHKSQMQDHPEVNSSCAA